MREVTTFRSDTVLFFCGISPILCKKIDFSVHLTVSSMYHPTYVIFSTTSLEKRNKKQFINNSKHNTS